jgi:hypothetical protein
MFLQAKPRKIRPDKNQITRDFLNVGLKDDKVAQLGLLGM